MTASAFLGKGKGVWVWVIPECPFCGELHEHFAGNLATGQPNDHKEQECPTIGEPYTIAANLKPQAYRPVTL